LERPLWVRAEIAHVDLIIGDKDGLAEVGFSFGLAHQSYGHTSSSPS